MHIVITLQDIVTLILGSFLLGLFIFCRLADRQAKRKEKEEEKEEEDENT